MFALQPGVTPNRAANPPSQKYNWYVDSVGGSDSNTGKSRGQPLKTLAELQGRNLALWSQDFANAAWAVWAGASKVGITAGIGPSGEDAMEISFGATPAACVYQNLTALTSQQTSTWLVRAKTGSTTIRLGAGSGPTYTGDLALTTAWTALTQTAAQNWDQLRVSNNAAGTSGNIYAVRVQLNDGGSTLSYIATTTATASMHPISTGQTVGLARGSVWREKFSVPANSVTIAAYGAGTRPLLDCSDAIAAGGWSKTAGRTNVYEVSASIDATTEWVGLWENGAQLVRVADTATCDATPGSYTCNDGVNPTTLYVHASDSSNPGVSGKTYEYSRRTEGLDAILRSGTIARNIYTRRNLGRNGSLVGGPTSVFVNCLAESGNKHNVYCGPGSVLIDVEASQAYYGGSNATLFVFNANTPAGEPVTFDSCYAHNTSYLGNAVGFYGHANVSGSFGTVTFRNCRSNNVQTAFGVGDANANALVFEGGTSTGCQYVCTPVVQTVVVTTFTATSTDITFGGLATGGTLTLGSSTLKTTNGFGNTIYLTHTCTVVATNNSIDSSHGKAFYADPLIAVNLTSRQNSFLNQAYNYSLPAGYALDSDYNIYSTASNPVGRVALGTNDWLYADYKTATGQDAHSTVT